VRACSSQRTNVHFIILTNGNKGCGAAFCQNFSTDEIASCELTFTPLVAVPATTLPF
jgi:hypothetical protein